jgi:integrase/recombinase XerD
MASVVILLRTCKLNTKNEAPIYLRIIKDRKPQYISLGIWVNLNNWDAVNKQVKKGHPNMARTNKFITEKFLEAHDKTMEMVTNTNHVSSKKLKEGVMGKSSESFYKYTERYIADLKAQNKVGTLDKLNAIYKKLKAYTGNNDLMFDEITIHWLKNYETYLRGTLGNTTNTIHSNLKVIRRIFNEAIREELFPFERNPFLRYKLKWEKTSKEFLEEDELEKIAALEINPEHIMHHHRNLYLIAAEAGGLRISDLLFLQRKQYDGTRILLDTQKTGSTVSIKVPQKAKALIDSYITEALKPDDLIFPIINPSIDLNDKQACLTAKSSATAYVNKNLKLIAKKAEIKKEIHFHTSRHTFATRALRKGMRIEYVSKLLGHSSIKTTQIYAKIVNEELDKAMDIFND